MTTRTRTIIVFTSCLIAVIMATVIIAWLFIGSDWFKERLASGLGESLDMDVSIERQLRFGLRPGPKVVLEGVQGARDGQVIVNAESVSLRLALPSLLFGNLEPLELDIERLQLWIERYDFGVFNINDPDSEPEKMDALSLQRLKISDARLNYVDQISELEWLAEHCNLELHDIQTTGGFLEQVIASLAARGNLTCQTLRQDQFAAGDVSAELVADDGVLVLKPLTAILFDSQLSGRLDVDFSSTSPAYTLESSLADLEISTFMEQMDSVQNSAGTMDLELLLRGNGSTWQDIRNSASGTINLRGSELDVEGFDLDKELNDYAKTQHFSLIDIGAVFLAGPVGLAVTRGHTFTSLMLGKGGSTRIEKVVSEWAVEGGVARAQDVAFRTAKNRIALAGGLDFTDYRFEELRVAVIDRDGCAIIDQQISGSFRNPSIEKPNILVTVMGPLTDLVNQGLKAVSDTTCETFYSGSISHPQ